MRYTRKRDIIEITMFITIIIFFIITAFFDGFTNESNAKKEFMKENLNSVQNILESNIEVNTNLSNSNNINNLANAYMNLSQNNEINITNNVNSNLSSSNKKSSQNNEIIDKNNKWRIEIPKINLNAPIKEGTTQEVMLEAVGHFAETSKDSGNIGLAAHNRGYKCNFFERIKELNKGDKIIYKTANKTRTYLVETNTVIQQTNWNYLKPTEDNRITLITCEKDKKEYRRCIQAIEIK